MKFIKQFSIILLLNSCSSLKKTLIYSSLTGALTGATSGVVLSPNKESRAANAAVFGLIGAGIATLTGYALYKEDPRNYKLKNMLIEPKKKNLNGPIELGLGALQINANLNKDEAYRVPVKTLPDKLKGKVIKQYLIKYQSKERYIKKGKKTFYIPSFEVYEHAYGDSSLSTERGILEK